MTTPTTPAEIAAKVAEHFNGKVMTCEVADMDGMWAVRARVKPSDGRKRDYVFSDIADTRSEAITTFINGLPLWVQVLQG